MTENKTFVRITNKDIYAKLEVIESRLSKFGTRVKINTALIGLIILVLVAVISRVL